MKTIGIDIGTTTICAVLADADSGELLTSKTLKNASGIPSSHAWERLQQPEIILESCRELLRHFLQMVGDEKEIVSIGVTGQMHGIVYLNAVGSAVSPLYTWQDRRGNEEYKDGRSYAQYMTKKTGMPMATGFGLTTHFYNLKNNLVPEEAVTFCTIPDYVALSLTGNHKPKLHPSMAASLGLYHVEQRRFSEEALDMLHISKEFLPEITKGECLLGKTADQIPVAAAFGDNQASFLGAVDASSNLLVNVGTGSQISVFCNSFTESEEMECRPYIDKSCLLVGASLCGGHAYAIVKNFFEETLQMCGMDSVDGIYEIMNREAMKAYQNGQALCMDTRFNGTRKDPEITGAVTGLKADNLRPGNLAAGTLLGICKELHHAYAACCTDHAQEIQGASTVVGSGNGIRNNPLMQKIFCDTFGMSMKIPLYLEEAAYGSALYAIYCAGYYKTLEEIQALIRYQSA